MESTMPWTETTRLHYRRDELRYASDLKDGEWAVIAPFMPEPSHLGRPRKSGTRQGAAQKSDSWI
jgi:hypothetical protein